MAHRVAPISFSIALGYAPANAVKVTAGGCSTDSSTSLTFQLHAHMSSARREGSEYHFKSLYDSGGARTYDLPVMRKTLYHWAIILLKYMDLFEECGLFPIQSFDSSLYKTGVSSSDFTQAQNF